MEVDTNELKRKYEHIPYMLYPVVGTFTFIFPFNPFRNPVRKLYLRDLLLRSDHYNYYCYIVTFIFISIILTFAFFSC